MLRSDKLYARNRRTGEEGYTLAAALLFGDEEVIADVCPSYKTDAIARIEDEDRYDDRMTVTSNLIDAYDRLISFAKRHISDRFVMEDGQRISARDIIIRELVSNLLIHREYISLFPAKLVIEKHEVRTENASRSLFEGRLELSDFNPVSKNPTIAGVFTNIGFAEELGSGMRNLQKYSRAYSGKPAELVEGDVFRASVPLTPRSASRGPEGIYEAVRTLEKRDGKTTSASLAEYLGVSSRTAQRYLRRLVDEGYVSEGEGRPKAYRIA